MRVMKLTAVLLMFLMCVSLSSPAAKNQFGVADSRKVTFNAPIRVGDVVLPKGEYVVRHTMQGENHIMVFTQLKNANPAEARVKYQLVPLPEKARATQVVYKVEAVNARVLQELIFAGDTAKHVF